MLHLRRAGTFDLFLYLTKTWKLTWYGFNIKMFYIFLKMKYFYGINRSIIEIEVKFCIKTSNNN